MPDSRGILRFAQNDNEKVKNQRSKKVMTERKSKIKKLFWKWNEKAAAIFLLEKSPLLFISNF
ncbi:MAG TPA: hypothetical protein PLX48_02335 [Candidatus Paceibacterota bacterium]|nr:hypothetical protein [Candidatus Paceibacterota bacterium]